MKKLATLVIMLLAAEPVLAQPAPAQSTPAQSAPAQSVPTGATPSTPKAADAANTKTPESRVDQRITQMHRRLKITAEQQPAWDAFAKVMRNNVTSADQAYKDRAATTATMSAPDNMRNFAQIEQDRAQGVQALAASFQTLYDALSDDQKKTADAMFRHYENRGAARKPAPK